MTSRLALYREWQLDQLHGIIPAYRTMLAQFPPDKHNTVRDGGTGWTVVEVICHLRDFDRIFQERAEITIREEYGELPFPDGAQLARQRNYNALSSALALNQWEAARLKLLKVFDSFDPQDDEVWEQMGAHPTRGPFNLNDQLMLTARHDVLHLKQVAKIIREA